MQRTASVLGEIAGGLASAIPALVYALTLGLLAFGSLGAEHIDIGLRAGFAAAIFGTAVAALGASTQLSATGPRASVTLVLTGFVLLLAHDPALNAEEIVALASLCVIVAGAIQLLFGVLKLGAVAKFVPYPVVAGFMCGIAVLIVASQLGALGLTVSDAGIERVQLTPLLVGIATALSVWIIESRKPRWPAPLFGLAFGVAIHFGIAGVIGAGSAGALVGDLPAILMTPADVSRYGDLFTHGEAGKYIRVLVTTSFVIAIIGSLDSLLASVGIDAVAETRHRANRKLLAQGFGNIA